jgi:tRNA threonylcarbamoyladenosine biosynthesis protein TsaB
VKLLAVDTALGACSVALFEDDRLIAHIFEPMERGHAERLAPMVDEAMKQAGMEFAALNRLAITVGPGTFTGQRVGLAFMRGLRLALHIPLTGVTTLEAMAMAAMDQTGFPKAAAIHDARRAEAYLLLRDGGTVVQQPVVLPFADAVARIANFGACALAGTGAASAHEKLGRDFALSNIRQPDALWVARLAQKYPAPTEQALFSVTAFDPTADTAPLAALHAACFKDAWDAASLRTTLAAPGAFAFHDRDGFVVARVAGDEAEILTLAVAPGARGKGLGRALLNAAIAEAEQRGAKAVFLEVGSDNPAALALYAALGFANVGSRKGYYGGRDASVLRLSLPADLP